MQPRTFRAPATQYPEISRHLIRIRLKSQYKIVNGISNSIFDEHSTSSESSAPLPGFPLRFRTVCAFNVLAMQKSGIFATEINQMLNVWFRSQLFIFDFSFCVSRGNIPRALARFCDGFLVNAEEKSHLIQHKQKREIILLLFSSPIGVFSCCFPLAIPRSIKAEIHLIIFCHDCAAL